MGVGAWLYVAERTLDKTLCGLKQEVRQAKGNGPAWDLSHTDRCLLLQKA
jgi:hypothetical protein